MPQRPGEKVIGQLDLDYGNKHTYQDRATVSRYTGRSSDTDSKHFLSLNDVIDIRI